MAHGRGMSAGFLPGREAGEDAGRSTRVACWAGRLVFGPGPFWLGRILGLGLKNMAKMPFFCFFSFFLLGIFRNAIFIFSASFYQFFYFSFTNIIFNLKYQHILIQINIFNLKIYNLV